MKPDQDKLIWVKCPRCGGIQTVKDKVCPRCGGAGGDYVKKKET